MLLKDDEDQLQGNSHGMTRHYEDFRAYQDFRGGSFEETAPNVVATRPLPEKSNLLPPT